MLLCPINTHICVYILHQGGSAYPVLMYQSWVAAIVDTRLHFCAFGGTTYVYGQKRKHFWRCA